MADPHANWSSEGRNTDTIPHLAAAAAAVLGDEPAVLERGETWTYAQLWQEVRRCASALLAAGIVRGDRIAIWAPNSREWIVAAIAAMTAGAAIVPLNTRLKGREAGDILRRTNARIMFTVGEFLGNDYPALLAEEDLPDLERTILLDGDFSKFLESDAGADDGAVDRALESVDPADVSDIMFTSGTTGVPKGVLTTHDRIIPMFRHWVEVMGLKQADRYLIINPFFHSFGFKAGWVAAMIAGAVIVPMATFDIAEVARKIEDEQINFLPGPPTIFQSLLAAKAEADFDVSSLRGGTTGAASVPPELVRRIRSELGIKDIVTAYGMTECSTITSCRRGDDAELIATSVGKAIPGLEVRIADENGNELARGETGEILVRGYAIMKGYLDDPAATAEAIDEDGWLHTGDIGDMDADGYVRITDRKKDMYISGGFNCYPAEIEKLLSANPEIGMVAVVGIPDERMGEVGKAFVVPRPGAHPTHDALVEWSRENMANYKVPRQFEIVAELPLNASGKVLKTELRKV
ncbi:MAG: FadD3 family acyl-CoA ligase [Blastomonas sp.]